MKLPEICKGKVSQGKLQIEAMGLCRVTCSELVTKAEQKRAGTHAKSGLEISMWRPESKTLCLLQNTLKWFLKRSTCETFSGTTRRAEAEVAANSRGRKRPYRGQLSSRLPYQWFQTQREGTKPQDQQRDWVELSKEIILELRWMCTGLTCSCNARSLSVIYKGSGKMGEGLKNENWWILPQFSKV